MEIRSLARLALAGGVLAIGATLSASSPKFFQAATQADFLKGDVENLSIDGRGQLVLGPATDLIYETPSPFLWTTLAAADGSLYVGTGNDGRVYRVDPQGRGSVFFDAPELEVHAIAPAPNGGLYVATSPDGKIYRVDRNGTGATFFDPDERYIWTLAADTRGTLYAGTGERGIVYKISADGRGEPFYQTRATHATSLALDRAGVLFVGTESPGRVFRVDGEGKGFMLLDTSFQEIRMLRFDDKGQLYAAAVSGRTSGGTPTQAVDTSTTTSSSSATGGAPVPSVSVSTEVTAIAVVDTPSGASGATRIDTRTAKGGVFRIAPDGLWDQLWESREDSPYDLTFDAEGRVLIGTGGRGKIYRLDGNPAQPMLLARASAQQVTSLYRDARGNLLYATANPGKLFRLSSARAPRGTYESEVRDAGMVSTWGAISWRGAMNGGRVEFSTRSGNSETPDETWSAWSTPYTVPQGSPITSPKARYLQWRAVLSGTGDGPALSSVTAAYLQRNLRPDVRTVTVHPPGIVFQKPYGTGDPDLAGFENQTTPDRRLAQAAQNAAAGSGLGRRTYQKGLQTIQWRAEDDNNDELAYDVWYRREGDTAWKALRRDFTESILVWDTTTVPNGTYLVRVVASDGPSNALNVALTGELESSAFEIDNTPPVITVGNVRVDGPRTLITFDVTDDHSPLQRAESSQDGQIWRGVFPADGISDSRAEHYELAIDGALGPKGLTLRVSDAMNNIATAQVDPPRAR